MGPISGFASRPASFAAGTLLLASGALAQGTVGSLADGTYVVRAFSGAGLVGELYDGVNEFDLDLATPVSVSGGATVAGIDFALGAAGSISGSITGLAADQTVNLAVEDAITRRGCLHGQQQQRQLEAHGDHTRGQLLRQLIKFA